MALIHLGEFFFFLLVPLRLQEIIGHVGFDSSSVVVATLFYSQVRQVPFPILPFSFRVNRLPYYILIIWALVLFFTIPFIATMCWRQFFVYFHCVILFERLDI